MGWFDFDSVTTRLKCLQFILNCQQIAWSLETGVSVGFGSAAVDATAVVAHNRVSIRGRPQQRRGACVADGEVTSEPCHRRRRVRPRSPGPTLVVDGYAVGSVCFQRTQLPAWLPGPTWANSGGAGKPMGMGDPSFLRLWTVAFRTSIPAVTSGSGTG